MANKTNRFASTRNFKEIYADGKIDELEEAYELGITALSRFENGLQTSKLKRKELLPLTDKIEKCRQVSTMTDVYVALLGDSGSGKSLLLSSLLDKEDVVPSGCAGAFTSAICDIAYNERDSEYYVEVVMHDRESMRNEFQATYDDLFDQRKTRNESGFKTSTDTDSQQGDDTTTDVGMAKIRALFPEWKKSSIDSVTMDELFNDPKLDLLGTTQIIETNDQKEFTRKLTRWITSTETVQSDDSDSFKRNSDDDVPSRQTDYWPMVNVVKIFVKAPLLRHGLHLIDLPGLQDCNVARRMLTKDYIKRCTEMILVSDIARATTGQSLEDQITTAFKTQCQLDGKLTDLTIACTKSDLCSAKEVMNQLGSTSELKHISSRLADARRALKTSKESTGRNDASRSYGSIGQKRKAEDMNDFYQRPKNFQHASRGIDYQQDGEEIHQQQTRIDDLVSQIQTLESQEKAECISIRNKHVKKTLRLRLMEIVEETFYEGGDDEEDIEERQKYQQVLEEAAQSLKVLTISALAYQNLHGRLQEYGETKGFTSVDSTEIPILQEHCETLAILPRKRMYLEFLTALHQLFQTSEFQLENSDTSIIGQSLGSLFRKSMKGTLESFDFLFRSRYHTFKTQLEKQFMSSIFTPIRDNKKKAIIAAQDVVKQWGKRPREGGFIFHTYRALCRRHGVFTNRQKIFTDWNEELSASLMSHVAAGWSLMFVQLVPDMVKTWINECNTFIENFETDMIRLIPRFDKLPKRVELLCREVRNKKDEVRRTATRLLDLLAEQQKDLNRELGQKIQASMTSAYDASARESGRGMFDRMRFLMNNRVTKSSEQVFGEPLEKLQKDAYQLLERLFEHVREETHSILNSMERDMENAIETKTLKKNANKQGLRLVVMTFADDFKDIENTLNHGSSDHARRDRY